MITLKDLHKSFGGQTLFEGACLQINSQDRYALVGPNGAGKSTLFKILLGAMEPDGGEIQLRKGVTAGYLPQENAPVSPLSVLETALSGHEDPDGRLTAKAKAVLMGLGFTIPDFERPVSSLSGGWAMRAAMTFRPAGVRMIPGVSSRRAVPAGPFCRSSSVSHAPMVGTDGTPTLPAPLTRLLCAAADSG